MKITILKSPVVTLAELDPSAVFRIAASNPAEKIDLFIKTIEKADFSSNNENTSLCVSLFTGEVYYFRGNKPVIKVSSAELTVEF